MSKRILCIKLKLTILGDEQTRREQYKIIRDEQYQQYRALNLCMNLLNTHNVINSFNSGAECKLASQINKINTKIAKVKSELGKENIKETVKLKKQLSLQELREEVAKLNQNYSETSKYRSDIDSKFKEMYIDDLYSAVQNQVDFKAKDMMSLVIQRVKQDFATALKNGMARGERSLTTYKRDYPLLTRGERSLKFKYRCENSDDVIIDWLHGITFKVILPIKKADSSKVRHTLDRIINKEIKMCDSLIQFDNKNNIILNLTMEMDKVKEGTNFVDSLIMGVDLGMRVPAVASFNNIGGYKNFGSIDDFLRVRMQMQSRRKKLQVALTTIQGGHGRTKKLAALDRFKKLEKNFVNTYNHTISKRIIDYALKNNCGNINLELLSIASNEKGLALTMSDEKIKKNREIKRNWSYYDLQQKIIDKAKRAGIKVLLVDPYLTSQTCHMCGHYEENQRYGQVFICKKCAYKTDADFNASKNIAMSKKYIKKKEDSQFYKNNKKTYEN